MCPCHKLWFSNPYIFVTQYWCNLRYFKLWILLDWIIKVWSIKRFTLSGCKDIELRQIEFVANKYSISLVSLFFPFGFLKWNSYPSRNSAVSAIKTIFVFFKKCFPYWINKYKGYPKRIKWHKMTTIKIELFKHIYQISCST